MAFFIELEDFSFALLLTDRKKRLSASSFFLGVDNQANCLFNGLYTTYKTFILEKAGDNWKPS